MGCTLFVVIATLLVVFPLFVILLTHNLLDASGVLILDTSRHNKENVIPMRAMKQSSDILISKIRQHIVVAGDIVYQGRVCRDSAYSFATTYPSSTAINHLSRYYDDYKRGSYNGYTSGVPIIAWTRNSSDMFFKRNKTNTLVTVKQLGQNMLSIINSGNGNIKAIRYVLGHRLCYLLNQAGSLDDLPVPVLFTTRFDENFGFMSSDIPGRTCMVFNYERSNHTCRLFGSVKDMLADCGHSVDDMQAYFDHKNFLLLVTTQQQSFEHKKVISFPLGVRPHVAMVVAKVLPMLASNSSLTIKRKLLTVNFNTRYFRESLMLHYQNLFGENNSYELQLDQLTADKAIAARKQYLLQLAASKFVLCPAGLGADTYRMWETLTMGSFPVVETAPGLDKLFSNLPVLVVYDIFRVTKELLEEAYDCFMRHAEDWKYELLTQPYWDYVILKAMETASIEHITSNHPLRNPHCDFFEKSKM